MTEFDDATRLETSDTPGRRRGTFTDEWMIGAAVNGGLVMAVGLTALGEHLAAEATETTGHADPLVLSAHFLTASLPGPFTVATEVIRTGRTLSTGQISIGQPGPDGVQVERMRAIGSFGDLAGVELTKQTAPPDLPPPDRCLSADDAPAGFLDDSKFLDRVDVRIDPATAGFVAGRPSMHGVVRGWLRLRDGREPDPIMLMMALDGLPPVSYDLGMVGWTPTIEFTGHLRRHPEPGWLLVALSSENVGAGRMEEDASIWDSAGNLVAQSRQLCATPRPRPA